ncbi:MAG: VOC family protein [Gammaproteobacteria bacterium]|jgi:catechol 2,3-dioxygenase-like lactoylglutathione lyase family enzyme|nr:MAG: VOC family protein [Gammaproteobacteria bacterium]
MTEIKNLHHAAYRCRDSEETRAFYEDFLGLRLSNALPIGETKSGRKSNVLHTFFEMADGSCLAFFEEPEAPFDFKDQRDFDLHIALEVSRETLLEMFEKGKAAGIETRGISDHGFIDSIYFRDPNGYVIELTTVKEDASGERPDAHQTLADWQAAKQA